MRRGRRSSSVVGVMIAAALALPAVAGSGSGGPGAKQAPVAEIAIFYYPWYSTPARDGHWAHWYVHRTDGQPQLSTKYFPARGLYSSSNVKVVDAQMREIAATGVGTLVVSWWGFGSAEDARLPLVTSAAGRHGLEIAIHLEPYIGRTPETAAADISRLARLGYTDFYVYEVERDPVEAWAEALSMPEIAGLDLRVFGQTYLAGRAKAAGFDGLYTYDVATWNGNTFARLCSQAHRAGLLCAPSVGPGYDARLTRADLIVKPRSNGATYDRMWRAAVRANPDVVSITSYNEWQEGTQIEPARPQVARPAYEGAWGKRGVAAQRAYLDATARWVGRYRASFSS